MGNIAMAAALENIHKANQIGLDIGVGIFQRIANTGLCRQIDHPVRARVGKNTVHRGSVLNGGAREAEAGMWHEPGESRLFQRDIIIVIQIINSDDLITTFQQTERTMHSDKASRPVIKTFMD